MTGYPPPSSSPDGTGDRRSTPASCSSCSTAPTSTVRSCASTPACGCQPSEAPPRRPHQRRRGRHHIRKASVMADETVAGDATELSQPGGSFAARGPGVVDEVTPEVHLARNFHMGSVIRLTTPDGGVVIDTTGGARNATAARDALWAQDPVDTRYVIYTHCHNDHVRGAEPFLSDRTEAIVAHELLEPLQDRYMRCLGNFLYGRLKSHQLGSPVEVGGTHYGHESPFVAPSLTFRHDLDIEVGGQRLHLEHTEGETRDHLLVWMPDLSVLCCGDLYYPAFPNLSSPGVGPRPIQGWIRSLDRFLEIDPVHLVPSHGPSLSGRELVRDTLTAYRDAIAYVWDESLRCIDAGLPVQETARQVHLPPSLAQRPFLQELYGTVSWGVRAVYANLTGWYDGDPASLNSLPRSVVNGELLALAYPDRLAIRAAEVQAAGD